VDTLAWHQEAWVELGRRSGLPITASFIHETFGMTNPAIFRRLLGDAIDAHEADRLAAIKEECYREAARGRIELMNGVGPLLDALTDEDVLLAIGSSAVRANLDLTVSECGLTGRFAAIAALEDIQRGKPDPQVFLVAAARAGVHPSRTVVFEDAPVGIVAARAAGMRAVGVTTSHSAQTLREAGANEVVESLAGYDVNALLGQLRTTQEPSRRL
jgi:HAD superfamily hydrolase (TIGR01509 family)